MAKVKGDRDWSRDLSLCVADDFLYVYDVSVLFDFRLHDGEVCNRSLNYNSYDGVTWEYFPYH